MITAILVDDELQSNKALAIKLESVAPDIQIIGIFEDPAPAIDAINSLKPSLVFMDIEMPGLSGFELLSKIDTVESAVIFITAFDKYMLTALHESAFDYLLKPVDPTELKNAVDRYKKKHQQLAESSLKKATINMQLDNFTSISKNKRLSVATKEGIIFLKFPEIIKIEASSNYSAFFLTDKRKIIASKTLKDFEILLPSNFFRVSRSCIINLDFIVQYKHEDGGMIQLQDGTHVAIGPHRKDQLINLLSGKS